MNDYFSFVEYWFPSIRNVLWLGFLIYLFSILRKTYRQARERKRLEKRFTRNVE